MTAVLMMLLLLNSKHYSRSYRVANPGHDPSKASVRSERSLTMTKLIRVDHMGTFWVPFGYLLGTF